MKKSLNLIFLDFLSLLITIVPFALASLVFQLIFFDKIYPFLLFIPLFLYLFLVVYILIIGGIFRVKPSLKEGSYNFPSSKMASIWMFSIAMRKVISLTFIRQIYFSLYSLKFLYLRALLCKAHLDLNTGFDVMIGDPELLEIGANSMIANESYIGGHFIYGKKLVLKKVKIGQNVTISASVRVGPGVSIGDDTIIQYGVSIYPDVKIGKNVRINSFAVIESGCVIEDNAIIDKRSIVVKSRK